MATEDIQTQCERGQELLMQTKYLEAEAVLAEAEALAWEQRDFDTLSRLYMPLQEARRQRRQRCGEGVVALALWAEGPSDQLDGRRVVENYPHGQLLVAGWGTTGPAEQVRQLQREHELYVETFLGAVYPAGDRRAVVIVPLAGVNLPDPEPRPVEDLRKLLPEHSIILHEDELPADSRPGDADTFAQVMALWERLHLPFLAAAETQAGDLARISAYRRVIQVDYACELAHQHLSDCARRLARETDKSGR